LSSPANRHSTIVLYSDPVCIHCHRVRLVLAEKDIKAEVIDTSSAAVPEELLQVNPAGSLPTLIDRDLAVYHASVVNEYLDERYPHPPFLPVDPVSRARTRLAMHRIELDWYAQIPALTGANYELRENAARQLGDSITASASVFAAMPFFLSEDYSILDATLAPLLWRLQQYGIVLPSAADPVKSYAERIFNRAGFQASLSVAEKALRNGKRQNHPEH